MSSRKKLIITPQAKKDIAKAINRIFMLHTDHVTVTFAPHAIIVHVFPEVGQEFGCPEGLSEIRLKRDKYELLGPGF